MRTTLLPPDDVRELLFKDLPTEKLVEYPLQEWESSIFFIGVEKGEYKSSFTLFVQFRIQNLTALNWIQRNDVQRCVLTKFKRFHARVTGRHILSQYFHTYSIHGIWRQSSAIKNTFICGFFAMLRGVYQRGGSGGEDAEYQTGGIRGLVADFFLMFNESNFVIPQPRSQGFSSLLQLHFMLVRLVIPRDKTLCKSTDWKRTVHGTYGSFYENKFCRG